jgi:hypothetical protein
METESKHMQLNSIEENPPFQANIAIDRKTINNIKKASANAFK